MKRATAVERGLHVIRSWHLHGQLDSYPSVSYRGAPADHAECHRIVAAIGEARRAFRAATHAYDFGAAVSTEQTWRALEVELRRVLRVLRHPHLRPFSPEEIDAAVFGVRRRADTVRRVLDEDDDTELEDDDMEDAEDEA